MRSTFARLVLMLSVSLFPGLAQAQTSSVAPDEWELALTPFLWAPGMSGDVGLAGQQRDFDVSVQDLLSSLDFGFMANFQGRKGRWSLGVDYFYADLGKDVSVANPDVSRLDDLKLDMTMTIVEGDVGYEIVPSLDLLAGARGVGADAGLVTSDVTLREADAGFVDPIVGARLHRYVTETLWVNLRGDVGGFGAGSDFSWFVGASGGVRLSRLLSLDFGYRTWGFDYESDNDLKRLDLTLAGFGGGLTFHF